jgi:lipoprotein-anchoring transpeptidase ErfK/SrfK
MTEGPGIARRRLALGAVFAPVLAVAVAGWAGAASGVRAVANGARAAGSGTGPGGAPIAATTASTPTPKVYPPVAITTVPADGAAGVDPSLPVTVSAVNGTVASVQLTGGSTGGETSGTLSTDNSSWTSNGTLNIDSSYQLLVQVTGQDGKTVTATANFSTLKPTKVIGVDVMWPDDGSTVGVGQPIRVQFTTYVPQEYRAEVEKACVVSATPPVSGAWYWAEDNMMDWRPQNYWATGTQVAVALNLDGVRAGANQFGVKNHTLNFTVRDTDLQLIVDASQFTATCYINGAVARTWPIDTGMPGETFITWQGTFAVLGKGNPVDMKGNYGPGDTYNDLVNWATQITYSGTYVHSAPWDPTIGHRNDDSHGCIHCHPADAEWFYGKAEVGDVVQVTGTDKPAAVTNGFADWTLAWTSWLGGSSYGATLNGAPVSA